MMFGREINVFRMECQLGMVHIKKTLPEPARY